MLPEYLQSYMLFNQYILVCTLYVLSTYQYVLELPNSFWRYYVFEWERILCVRDRYVVVFKNQNSARLRGNHTCHSTGTYWVHTSTYRYVPFSALRTGMYSVQTGTYRYVPKTMISYSWSRFQMMQCTNVINIEHDTSIMIGSLSFPISDTMFVVHSRSRAPGRGWLSRCCRLLIIASASIIKFNNI